MQEKKTINYRQGSFIYLVAIIGILAAQIALTVFMLVLFGDETQEALKNIFVQLASSAAIVVFYMAPIIIYFKVFNKAPFPRFRQPLRAKTSPINLLLAAVLPIITIFCFYLPAVWFDEFLTLIGYAKAPPLVFDGAAQIITAIVVVVLIAPFFEEIVYRGFLLSALTDRFKPLKAAIICGISFAFMHMNPEQTVYQFALGASIAFAVIKSNSLWVGIVAHAVSNLLALLLDVSPLGVAFGFVMNALTANVWLMVISTVVLAVIGVALIWLLGKGMKKRNMQITVLPLATPAPIDGVMQKSYANIDRLAGRTYFVIALSLSILMWAFVFIGSLITV